jgi:hypothetical protein
LLVVTSAPPLAISCAIPAPDLDRNISTPSLSPGRGNTQSAKAQISKIIGSPQGSAIPTSVERINQFYETLPDLSYML